MGSQLINQRWAALLTVLACAFLWSGCETTQSVVDIRQHPTQDVTVIHTLQSGWMDSGHRFWHCTREGEELICDVVCGDDIKCPQRPGLIRANRSAAAQLGAPQTAVAEPAPEPETDLSTQRDDDAELEEEEISEDDDEGGFY